MKNRGAKLLSAIIFMLVLLWVYTAASKLMDFRNFRLQMFMQALPRWLRLNLVWILPPAELLAAILLLFKKTEYFGLWVSLVLMTVFTIYVGLVAGKFFRQVPCSCGGVIKVMSWNMHLVFNLFFLLLTLSGIFLYNRERRLQNSIN